MFHDDPLFSLKSEFFNKFMTSRLITTLIKQRQSTPLVLK